MVLETVALGLVCALASAEQAKLQGNWEDSGGFVTYGFTQDRMTINANESGFIIYRIHPLTNPKGIDFLFGQDVMRCIYQIDRDVLRLGVPLPLAQKRPKTWHDKWLTIVECKRTEMRTNPVKCVPD